MCLATWARSFRFVVVQDLHQGQLSRARGPRALKSSSAPLLVSTQGVTADEPQLIVSSLRAPIFASQATLFAGDRSAMDFAQAQETWWSSRLCRVLR